MGNQFLLAFQAPLINYLWIALGVFVACLLFYLGYQLRKNKRKMAALLEHADKLEKDLERSQKRLTQTEAILRKALEKTKQKENEVSQKNSELIATEEELRLHIEEIVAIQEVLELQKVDLDQTNQKLHHNELVLKAALESAQESEMELKKRNEELKQKQEKIEAQKNDIEQKNKILEFAQRTISEQNERLLQTNQSLEERVAERARELNKAYEELLNAHTELDSLMYRSSHDLKGPVARIQGLCNLLRVDKQLTDVYLNQLENSIQEMTDMLNKIRKVHATKISSPERQEFKLDELMKGTLDEFLNIPSLHLQYGASIENMVIKTDFGLVKTIIQCLVLNSIQFHDVTKPVHSIVISLESDPLSKSLSIKVEDNGIGIPANIQPHIFDMFYRGTEHSSGFGLGLYEAKIAATKLHGVLRLLSSSPEGSVFELELPI